MEITRLPRNCCTWDSKSRNNNKNYNSKKWTQFGHGPGPQPRPRSGHGDSLFFMLSDHPNGQTDGQTQWRNGARQAKHQRVYRTHIEDCTHGYTQMQQRLPRAQIHWQAHRLNCRVHYLIAAILKFSLMRWWKICFGYPAAEFVLFSKNLSFH